MSTLAANWGYLGEHAVHEWGAHALLAHPLDLLALLDAAQP